MAAPDMQFDLTVAARLGVAALAGLAVGIEREWSGHATGPNARFAGVRTFFLLGVLGGLAGWLTDGGLVPIAAILLASGVLLTLAAYIMAARQGGAAIDGTTEAAALVVLALGTAAGLGFLLVASAIASIMVLALAEKTRIQEAIERLGAPEFAAALQFAVLALVVLPLLPEGPFGPYDSIRPRALWTVVLLFSALNFAGYLATRAIGASRGYSITGLLGGLVSSTAVTLQSSQHSRDAGEKVGRALGAGVIGACTVLLLRVTAITVVLKPELGLALAPYLAPVLGVGIVAFVAAYRSHGHEGKTAVAEDTRSPLGLWAAIKMALAFQVVLLAVPFVQQWLGPRGVLASAAVLGFTDVDALTYSMTRLADGADAIALGARGVAIGVLSNTALKLLIALIVGRGEFRRVAGPGLVALGIASGLGLWIGG